MIKDDDNMIAVYSNAFIEADNKVTVIFLLSMCSNIVKEFDASNLIWDLTKLLNRKDLMTAYFGSVQG